MRKEGRERQDPSPGLGAPAPQAPRNVWFTRRGDEGLRQSGVFPIRRTTSLRLPPGPRMAASRSTTGGVGPDQAPAPYRGPRARSRRFWRRGGDGVEGGEGDGEPDHAGGMRLVDRISEANRGRERAAIEFQEEGGESFQGFRSRNVSRRIDHPHPVRVRRPRHQQRKPGVSRVGSHFSNDVVPTIEKLDPILHRNASAELRSMDKPRAALKKCAKPPRAKPPRLESSGKPPPCPERYTGRSNPALPRPDRVDEARPRARPTCNRYAIALSPAVMRLTHVACSAQELGRADAPPLLVDERAHDARPQAMLLGGNPP